MRYLKRAEKHASPRDEGARETVAEMLAAIRAEGEAAVRRFARTLDGYEGPVVVPRAALQAAAGEIEPRTRADLEHAHRNIRAFADAQRRSSTDFEVELAPGLLAGQRCVPVRTAGCYVPGGRFAHAASALMTATTARAAGVEHVVACSPPRGGRVPAEILFALHLAGVDRVLCLGGVQGVASMAFGLFGAPRADLLVGPGNRYVAEAKRQLFGEVGIDLYAGPTEILVLADETADPEWVAVDLVSQAEHGPDSPAILVTTSAAVGEAVLERVPARIAALGGETAAGAAWRDHGEVVLAEDRDEAVSLSDGYAPEHLEVHCADLEWWHDRLRNYGSLFLGAETTVTFGDKCAGPNHVLPTLGAARYTGGLSVHSFVKKLTWQKMTAEAAAELAPVAARISRAEGMEAHARAADARAAD